MPLLAGLARDARRAFEPKPGTGYGYPGGGANIMHNLLGARTKSGQHVTDRRALALSAWQRAMEIRSNVPGTLPVHVYQKASDGRRLKSDAYPWITKRPNPEVVAPVFWVTVYYHLASWSNAYIWVRPMGGTVTLWPVEPKRVRAGRNEAGEKVYEIDGTVPAVDYSSKRAGNGIRLVHVQGWGTDGFTGAPRWEMGAESLGIGLGAQEKAGRWFREDKSPVNGYLSSDQELSQDEAEALSEAWDEARGEDDPGTAVLGKGTKWITTDIDPQKLQLLEARGFQIAEVSRQSGVPEHLLGSHDKQSSWGTGISEQNRGLLTYTIGPDIVIVEATISEVLLPADFYMKAELGGLLRGNPKEQADTLAIMRQNLIINANEWRELLDMDPQPGSQGEEYVNPNTTKNGAGPGAAATADANGNPAQPAA